MVLEKHITVYECSFCQRTYNLREDAEKCETRCAKLSGSPEISVLDLTPRTYNLLKIAGIDTVDEVLGKTDAYLLKLKGFGKVCLHDLHQRLEPFGGQTGHEIDQSRDPFIDIDTKRNARRQEFSNTAPLTENDEWINRTFDLPEFLENQIIQFVNNQDWAGLYKDYQWHNDTWESGFPDILRLETQMRCSLQNGEIKKQDILDVANWGKFSSPSKITSPESIPLSKEFLNDMMPLLQALITLEQNIRGLGATYLSDILRFLFPNRAGSLDSRIVRVFGIGDPTVNQYQWLTIRTQKSGTGWALYRNRMWHMEYEKWLRILTKMVMLINAQEVYCPHPRKFKDAGLRTEGIWISADVEMAIFAYVTGVIS